MSKEVVGFRRQEGCCGFRLVFGTGARGRYIPSATSMCHQPLIEKVAGLIEKLGN